MSRGAAPGADTGGVQEGRLCLPFIYLSDDEVVDVSDLAILVPGLMAQHGRCVWSLASGGGAGEDLVIDLSPVGHPDRVAVVRVLAGAEVFSFVFAGHVSTDFVYTDADRAETLRERIDLAVAAITGPTRVICDGAAGVIVRSTLIFDYGGSDPHPDGVVGYPFRRLKAWFKGERTTRYVRDFPAA